MLHPIKGKPLLVWVAERIAAQAPDLPLYFAVDHELLREAVAGPRVQGDHDLPGASERHRPVGGGNRTVQADRIINVQADEPLVSGGPDPRAGAAVGGEAPMATLATQFRQCGRFPQSQPGESRDPPGWPGALSSRGRRCRFRAILELTIDDAWVAANPCYKHLGLYAYHADLLERFASLPPGRYERIEKLEQLRVLENGYDIMVGLTEDPTIGVDTPEDARRFEAGAREMMAVPACLAAASAKAGARRALQSKARCHA